MNGNVPTFIAKLKGPDIKLPHINHFDDILKIITVTGLLKKSIPSELSPWVLLKYFHNAFVT